jgi:rhodanese-related sulfurtransferase
VASTATRARAALGAQFVVVDVQDRPREETAQACAHHVRVAEVGASAGDEDRVAADGVGGAQQRADVAGLLQPGGDQVEPRIGPRQVGQRQTGQGHHPEQPVGVLAEAHLREHSGVSRRLDAAALDQLGCRAARLGELHLGAVHQQFERPPGGPGTEQLARALHQHHPLALASTAFAQPHQPLHERVRARADDRFAHRLAMLRRGACRGAWGVGRVRRRVSTRKRRRRRRVPDRLGVLHAATPLQPIITSTSCGRDSSADDLRHHRRPLLARRHRRRPRGLSVLASARRGVPAPRRRPLGPLAEHGGRHPLPNPSAPRPPSARRVGPGSHVVAYDDGDGMVAGRVWWLLRWLGHDSVQVLDGGFAAWREAGGPETDAVPMPAPRPFEPAPRA